MANESSKKSENSGGREPKTVVLSPCMGHVGSNCGGTVFVTATNSDLSFASGSFVRERAKAKER